MEGHLLKGKIVRSKKWRKVEGDFPRLVYCLLVASVDSWGMLPSDGSTLKARLGPFDDIHDSADYEAAVKELKRCDLVRTWTHQDDPWLYVVNHDEEQARGIKRRKLHPDVPRPKEAVASSGQVATKTQQGAGQAAEVEVEVEVDPEVEVEGEDPDSRVAGPEQEQTSEQLLERYDGNELIGKALAAIASTRKSNKISESVRVGVLKKWSRCSAEAVLAGCRAYLEGDHASGDKRENYLWAIIVSKAREAANSSVSTVSLEPGVVKALTSLRRAHAKDGGYEVHGDVVQNATAARIALVLARYGEEGCLQIQRGHIAKGGKDFTSWPGAYPHVKGDANTPNWDWIAAFHKSGGTQERKWAPGVGPP